MMGEPTGDIVMNHWLWRIGTCALVLACLALAARADFPPVDKLAGQAELPHPLECLDGTTVKTKEEWRDKRRPELKKLFEHYMYGYAPPKPKNLEFKVERVDKNALGGKATLKEITISFGPPATPKLHLLLFVPNKRNGPAPVFLGMNFHGNHAVTKDPNVRVPTTWVPKGSPGAKGNRATDAGRGTQEDVWNVEQIIDRGYAFATIYCGDIDPDRPDVRDGIQAHLQESKQGPHSWGTIAAWAWGFQRAIDYLVTDADIDAARIIVVGHSRLGKTALLASAFDERVALAIPHQAGCGGTAPSRGKIGESVKQINDRFPHWFNGAFKKFNDHVERLPFDQHCLVAMMAPRPVLLSNATEDQWANPSGQFEMLKAAAPVYRLLGVEGLSAKSMPAEGKLVDSRLGYYIRVGKHSMNAEDWKVFIDFADRHLKKGS
jgi:(4-O-methyl)-D-glucuronate---lignin esterase